MPPDSTNDPLGEIDLILREHSLAVRALTEEAAQLLAEQGAFLDAFTAKCENEIAPTMEAIVVRLRENGGGGLVDYQPHGGRANTAPRLTFWMSLEGEISGTPRQDRHPYLQFDADIETRKVRVSEGDMWEGRGSHHSGPLGFWELAALTPEKVIEEVIVALRRAASEPDGGPKR